jgi:HSP20 family protein
MAAFEEMEELFEKLRKRLLREAERILAEAAMQADWTPDGGLRPLYTIYEYPDRYVILVDMAAADTSTLNVTATEDKLVLEARLQQELRLSDIYGNIVGREVSLRYYRHEIPLPPDADPKGIRVNVRPNKIVEIILPRKSGQQET